MNMAVELLDGFKKKRLTGWRAVADSYAAKENSLPTSSPY